MAKQTVMLPPWQALFWMLFRCCITPFCSGGAVHRGLSICLVVKQGHWAPEHAILLPTTKMADKETGGHLPPHLSVWVWFEEIF